VRKTPLKSKNTNRVIPPVTLGLTNVIKRTSANTSITGTTGEDSPQSLPSPGCYRLDNDKGNPTSVQNPPFVISQHDYSSDENAQLSIDNDDRRSALVQPLNTGNILTQSTTIPPKTTVKTKRHAKNSSQSCRCSCSDVSNSQNMVNTRIVEVDPELRRLKAQKMKEVNFAFI